MISKKEKWINETMQSIENLKPVEVSDALNSRIMQQIPTQKGQFIPINPSIKWAIAACIVFLIGLNGLTIYYVQQKDKESEIKQKNSIYTEYFSSGIEY